MARLFLFDGMALVYRAHFAFIANPIRNSKGMNTSAVFGFANILLSILEKEKPTHLGVAFDTSAPTPRHKIFPAYKAHRDKMPEELAAAIPIVKHLCEAFHIPVIEIDGYEADDVIGTLAARADADGLETFMVTSDKDFAQLVTPTARIWRPGRKGADHEIIDVPRVLKDWNVTDPKHVPDILGLWGDASDNIPGVPGVGEKTAKKLIGQFGSMDELLARTDELKGKLREKIETHADAARLSRDLATIMRDAPADVTWDDLALTTRDNDEIKRIFAEMDFKSLARRLFGEWTEPPADAADPGSAPTPESLDTTKHDYRLADTPEKQAALFETLSKAERFCFDIETTSLDRFSTELLGIAFSEKPGTAWYLPFSQSARKPLAELLGGPAEKIGHNLKFDLAVLLSHGIEAAGPFFDTMLAHILVSPDQRHTMDHLAEALLGYTPVKLADLAAKHRPAEPDDPTEGMELFAHAKTKMAADDLDMRAIPVESLAEYAAEDADITLQLADALLPLLEKSGQSRVFREIESPLLPVLVRIEHEGITVDLDALSAASVRLQQRIEELRTSIRHHAGRDFNLNSPKQLGEILFNELKLAEKPKKTKTGQYKTDEQTLSALAGTHPIIDDILAYREAAKLKSTYVDALPGFVVPSTGRIHTHLHQLVAATGRLASSDPNLQNIPVRSEAGREIRRAFVARGPEFLLLSCDYSQIELRIMAAISGDTALIEDFRAGRDIHTATAARVHGVEPDAVSPEMRSGAKMVNFGIIYGISAFGLSQRLGIPRKEAAAIIDAYFANYPGVKEFMERTVAEAAERGWVETLHGRRRHLPDLQSRNNNVRTNAERAAINTPIQGTAADMIKLAMIHTDTLLREQNSRTRMLLQVHDELIFDLHLDERESLVPRILETMQDALPLPNGVPVIVESGTGENWLEAH
jgi:DNA polymerase-1